MVPNQAPKSLSTLQAELRSIGLSIPKAMKTLPDWSEAALEHPSGVLEVQGFFARYFGLEVGRDGRLQRRKLPLAKFKTSKHTSPEAVEAARGFAFSVCRVVASAIRKPYGKHLGAASVVRTLALARNARWLGLSELLEVCWNAGVPVIYLPEIPITTSKMDGMVTAIDGRPVIFISKTTDLPAWVLFILAHEMGHIARGHLSLEQGATIVDEAVDEATGHVDGQEREANEYAIELLTGSVKTIQLVQMPRNASILARSAQSYGQEHKIDPGHVLLNMARNSKVNGRAPYALAQAALKQIEKPGSASELCRQALRRHIDVEGLSDNSLQFLQGLRLI